mmetsp:Transcript_13338/g.19385  ORF Transcript_13338/g.19385 Transcript_13338/m.19385 type:complete len:89 (+) Transcript_13338:54-320(+)|eukprot:CAMPEP_0179412070 /NCGR_PEP_ID=MMETSP0799-20121207/4252_1 /TAXON_ID=46947 /ORGANISM="Geminigera cryophila, Strain CCMP2564" /LENGTH=88 /DNA_ID=CAMNT_0021184217 /DNA_START=23 /DNA_END=289 /DNA_ORIENTATION=-
MIAPMPLLATPALSGMIAARGFTSLRMAADDPNQVGDLPAHDWGGDGNAHTNDPTPVTAENNSLGKKGAIGAGESFEEYLKKRAAQGK